ncbi:MAG: GDSL-type esterase/lipase family protein [Treponema sp.]|nr:GDSL-type esterase/lipase family protein [Treponema sp.]
MVMKKGFFTVILITLFVLSISACKTNSAPIMMIDFGDPGDNPIDELLARVNPNCAALTPVQQRSFLPELWAGLFRDQSRSAARRPETKIYFLGDSITAGFRGVLAEDGPGIESWNMLRNRYGADKIINMGIGGDQTQHVIYRLLNGIFPDDYSPEYVTLLLGTNNVGNTPSHNITRAAEEIAAGVGTICKIINWKSPQTKILLFPVLPRSGETNMAKINEINPILETFDGYFNIHYIDLLPVFQNPDGTLVTHLYDPDLLHLAAPGYAAWAEEIIAAIEGR